MTLHHQGAAWVGTALAGRGLWGNQLKSGSRGDPEGTFL